MSGRTSSFYATVTLQSHNESVKIHSLDNLFQILNETDIIYDFHRQVSISKNNAIILSNFITPTLL